MFPPKVCFETLSEKRKENELHRKYMLLGGPAENLLMILFHLQWLGAECHIPVLRISEK